MTPETFELISDCAMACIAGIFVGVLAYVLTQFA